MGLWITLGSSKISLGSRAVFWRGDSVWEVVDGIRGIVDMTSLWKGIDLL